MAAGFRRVLAQQPQEQGHQSHTVTLDCCSLLIACVSLVQSAGLQQFVWQHQLQRSDSISSVAVRHGVSTHAITVTNNLFSEHSLLSRTHVFIPGAAPVGAWMPAARCLPVPIHTTAWPVGRVACAHMPCVMSPALMLLEK